MRKLLFLVMIVFSTTSFADVAKSTNRYSLVFIMDSNCPHCQHFGSVVKKLEKDDGFKVYPFSPDGKGVAEYSQTATLIKPVVEKYFGNKQLFFPILILQDTQAKDLPFYVVAQGDSNYQTVKAQIETVLDYVAKGDNKNENK
jgi:hypothetical protein